MTLEEIIKRTDHIPSSVYEPEQALWLKYLSDLPGNPLIVDFGTGWAKSAVSLALACPQAKVVTFDIGETYVLHGNVGSLEEYEAKVADNIRRAEVTNIRHTVAHSLDQFLISTPIDVLNIDSDHTYETTKEEITKWLPLVKPGGLVMFHDYRHPNAPGVSEAIEELISYKDGEEDFTNPFKPFRLELIDKAYHPKVTTAIFKKI